MGQTARLLGEMRDWARASVVYDDRHGLWGGLRVELRGDGVVEIERCLAPSVSARARLQLSPAEAGALLAQLAEDDLAAAQIAAPERLAPDTGCARITISGAGGSASVDKYDHTPPHAAFDAARAALRALAERAAPADAGGG